MKQDCMSSCCSSKILILVCWLFFNSSQNALINVKDLCVLEKKKGQKSYIIVVIWATFSTGFISSLDCL